MWTHFMDMHSGGGQKEDYTDIYIEAPEGEAKSVFFSRFGHNPERVTCTCCGEDYAIRKSENLRQATAFHRGCKYVYTKVKTGEEVSQDIAWKPGVGILPGYKGGYIEKAGGVGGMFYDYIPLKKYLERKTVLVIYAKDIKDEERSVDVPEQGYIRQD